MGATVCQRAFWSDKTGTEDRAEAVGQRYKGALWRSSVFSLGFYGSRG